jgi:hypothetical protein
MKRSTTTPGSQVGLQQGTGRPHQPHRDVVSGTV